jgi:glutathione S-transferase
MILYYSPGSCSLSPHIVLREAGMTFTLDKVNIATHVIDGGADYFGVNPKGYVPVIELDDGARLSEGQAIVQWVADQVPDKKLAPPNGTFARARLQEWLSYVNGELHKQYSWLFSKTTPADIQDAQRQKLHKRYSYVELNLGGNYLMGDQFTVADAYLFTVMRWNHHTKVDTMDLPKLNALYQRIADRPAVKEAMAAEGIRA